MERDLPFYGGLGRPQGYGFDAAKDNLIRGRHRRRPAARRARIATDARG